MDATIACELINYPEVGRLALHAHDGSDAAIVQNMIRRVD